MYFLFYINCFVTNIKSVFLHQLWNNQCKIITLSIINFSSTIINPHPHQNHTLIHLSPHSDHPLKTHEREMKGNKATTQCEEKPKRTKQPSSSTSKFGWVTTNTRKKIKRKVDPTHWSNITAPLPTKYIGWTYFNNRLEI